MTAALSPTSSSLLLAVATVTLLASLSPSRCCSAFRMMTTTKSTGMAGISSREHHREQWAPGGRRHRSLVPSPPLSSTSRRPRRGGASLLPPGMSSTDVDNKDDDDDDTGRTSSSSAATATKFFELDDAFADDGTNVVGTKFFGGSSVKDELYVPEEEEMALVLQGVIDDDGGDDDARRRARRSEYRRFEDPNAFGDALAGRVGMALQFAINRILYDDDGSSSGGVASWTEDPSMTWSTPFPKSVKSGGGTPLSGLAASKSFYNRLDVAIISANTIEGMTTTTTTTTTAAGGCAVVKVRWDVGAVWPNLWESRVLLTGTSVLTIRDDDGYGGGFVLLDQRDVLDGGGDVVGALSSQLPPRFWDVYHIGMTPSAELDPRFDSPPPPPPLPLSLSSSGKMTNEHGGKKTRGLFSNYRLSYLPPRLVIEPSLVDVNGRDGRVAQALPNHAFTTAIKTMGPNKERFVPVTPVEVSISKAVVNDDGEGREGEVGSGSLVRWTIPIPPEFASRIALPLPAIDDDNDDDDENGESDDGRGGVKGGESPSLSITTKGKKKFTPPYTPGRTKRPPPTPPSSLSCTYTLRPTRLVATLPYAGNPQDEEVTTLRRRLYSEAVERDGHVPKLDPITGRPIFFFWMNDAKACFTRDGGLGMAVYEWRAGWSKSNEVGIELEP
ncbi:hypothetical protein ACHAXA_003454 [Cyclostephanos tholiformis]|uniref:Uncharacterized protein n=1 Tax=Cyclostephanos tholiformis TaxID=382380 RepID=A0ABD3R3Q9_9STRA